MWSNMRGIHRRRRQQKKHSPLCFGAKFRDPCFESISNWMTRWRRGWKLGRRQRLKGHSNRSLIAWREV
jgi:hypothetical protein